MGTDRNAYVLEHVVVLGDLAVVDRDAGIVDRLVDDAEGIGLWRPAEIIGGLRPISLPGCINLVDRHHLARLRLGQKILVVESPPGGGIAAKRFATKLRI